MHNGKGSVSIQLQVEFNLELTEIDENFITFTIPYFGGSHSAGILSLGSVSDFLKLSFTLHAGDDDLSASKTTVTLYFRWSLGSDTRLLHCHAPLCRNLLKVFYCL